MRPLDDAGHVGSRELGCGLERHHRDAVVSAALNHGEHGVDGLVCRMTSQIGDLTGAIGPDAVLDKLARSLPRASSL